MSSNLRPFRAFRYAARSAICSVWLIAIITLPGGVAVFRAKTWEYTPTSDEQRALSSIGALSLRGHLSFLASDALEGRATPSTGQFIAAEYIAAQFRRAGLEPGGTDEYFQVCKMKALQPNEEGFLFSIAAGGRSSKAMPARFEMDRLQAIHLEGSPVIKAPLERSAFRHLTGLAGKVVITEFSPSPAHPPLDQGPPVSTEEFLSRLTGFGPALLVVVDRNGPEYPGYFSRLHLAGMDPSDEGASRRGYPMVTVSDASIISAYDAMRIGDSGARLFMRLAAPLAREVLLRNVVGILRGSDPGLSDSYVMVSAHYDGTGSLPGATGDRIWNAANDDGSGTVSVIEIASALATLGKKPRRSVLFAAFFGEEKGSLGSRCYARNPVAALSKTVADINLEQLGRTDGMDGDRKNRAVVTGFDYSEVGRILKIAGENSGIAVTGAGDAPDDPYFQRSDNLPFAEAGIPAHTVCVALEFPDYHGAGDEWQKIDYANMESTDRMIALAVLMIAQSQDSPAWNPANSHARPFSHSWQKLHSR